MNENLPFKLKPANDNLQGKSKPNDLKLLTFQSDRKNERNEEEFTVLVKDFTKKCEELLHGENLSESYNSIFLSVDRNKIIIDLIINTESSYSKISIDKATSLLKLVDEVSAEDHKLFLLLQIFIYLCKIDFLESLHSTRKAKLEIVLDFYKEFLRESIEANNSNPEIIKIIFFRQIIINARFCILNEIKTRRLEIPKVERGFIIEQNQVRDDNNIIPFVSKKQINKDDYIKILENKYLKFEDGLRELFRDKYDSDTYQEYLFNTNYCSDEDLLQMYIESEEFINLL